MQRKIDTILHQRFQLNVWNEMSQNVWNKTFGISFILPLVKYTIL